MGDRTEPPPPPPDMYPPDTYLKDTYPLVTYPLDTYPLDTYPLGHIPPSHLPLDTYPLDTYPLGHLPPRTYTPQTLKCPIWFMHHVLIIYCTLKSIYFSEIPFICDEGAHRYLLCQEGLILTTTQALVRGGGGLCPCQMSILISILLACHGKNRGRMADRTCSIIYWSLHLL